MKVNLILIVLFLIISNTFSQEKEILNEIDLLLKSSYKSNEPGVAVLVAKNNEILFRKSYGMANLEMNIPMQTSHVFKIASITKPFTALAVFILIADEQLNLNDPITKFIPQLELKFGSVQIKHLLSHTSGIINYGDTEEFESLYSKYYFDFVNEEISSDSIISILNKYDLECNPGEYFSYCNSGYFLLERMIENITGETFDNYLKEKVFEPIKMANTGFYCVTDIIKARVPGYTDLENKIINNPHVFLDGIITKGDNGMISCIDDLFLWYQAIMNNEYFKGISHNFYNHPAILNDSSESHYSMGFFTKKLKGRKMLNHNGDGSGFSSSMIILPEDELFIIILGNNDLYSYGSSRYHEIVAKRIAALILNDPFPNYNTINISEENLKKLVGTYISHDKTVRKILYNDGSLYTQRGKGRKVQIFPYADNKFYYKQYLINVSFHENEIGDIMSLSLHYDDGRVITANRISDDNNK